MKKLLLAMAGLTFGAVPIYADLGHGPGWDGGTVNYAQVYYQGRGGEFRLTEVSAGALNLDLGAYSALTKGTVDGKEFFQSFCMETTEYVTSNMRIWVSEASVDDTGTPGVFGSGSHSWHGGQSGDNLDPKTAWLYTQFARGTLFGYGWGSSGYNGLTRAQTAGALQKLIWYTEGEITTLADGSQGFTLNTDQMALITQWNTLYRSSGWTGIGNVRVLQTYTGEGASLQQDQLYLMVPVPGAALLGALGLGLARWARRRMA